MSNKHTPGPWYARPSVLQVVDKKIWFDDAAAPELLTALESLVLFTKPSKGNAVALNNAHRVIAAARGGR